MKWTKKEENYLKRLIKQGKTFQEASNLITTRSYNAIRLKAKSLGLSNPLIPPEISQPEKLNELEKKVSKWLRTHQSTITELSDKYNVAPKIIRKTISSLKEQGYNVNASDEVIRLVREGVKQEPYKINVKEFFGGHPKKIWKVDNNGKKLISIPTTEFKFGAISDTHLGSKYERLDILNTLYDIFEKEKVKVVFHGGNYVDGEFRFNKYETHTHGFDEMIDYFVANYPQRKGVTTYFIDGDDHEGWWTQKTGLETGRVIEERAKLVGRNDLKYLGYQEADFILETEKGKSLLKLIHGGGGTAYADCVDDKTEILTEDGWKFFKDLKKEKVATLNPKSFIFEWQKPTKIIEEDYKGHMFKFNSRSFDLKVTPNHKLFLRRYPKGIKRRKFLSFKSKSHKKVKTEWMLEKVSNLTFRRQKWQMIKHSFGFKNNQKPMDLNLLKLYAWYITEGCGHKNGRQLIITQSKEVNPENYDEIKSILNNLNIKFGCYGRDKKDITISNKKLATEFKKLFGRTSREKRIPKNIKNLPIEQLRLFLDTLIKGDGWICKSGTIGYKSYSDKLLDDVQEIAIKCGYGSTKSKDTVYIAKTQVYPTINNKPKKVKYNGKIYCVNVPNHIMLIRRNGKTIWTGNSYSTQKIVEAFQEGEKPHILLVGHYHKNVYHTPRGVHTVQLGCFGPNTLITMDKGNVKIKDIKIGDKVLTHKNRFRRVKKLYKHKYRGKWVRLYYSRQNNKHQSILATEEHPLLTISKGKKIWKKIIDIKEGDEVLTESSPCINCGKLTPWYRKLCQNCNPPMLEINKDKISKGAIIREKALHPNRELKELLINKIRREIGKRTMKISQKRELKEMKKMEEQGYKCIPLNLVTPDFIGIKNGKITAFEVEHSKKPNYQKYKKVEEYYDDIKWIDISPKSNKQNNGYNYKIDKDTGFCVVKVTKKEIINKHPKYKNVYNFEVEEDNSYIAKKIVVHNCTQGQTRFMRKNKLRACLGGYLISINQAPTGEINRFKPEWIQFWPKAFYKSKITSK